MLGIDRSELGGCRLIRKIGAGAMGEVYLAEQMALGNRLVAVKVVHAEHDVTLQHSAGGGAGAGGGEEVEWHFIREAQLLGRLTHPNILPVYHSGVEDLYLFLVMEYVPGGSLADAIKGKGAHRLDLPASLSFVADIVAQVADALQYTHEHHVIHADVKPSNVLVKSEPDGRWHVLLADFGVARTTDSVALREEVAGTAAYMAPEQFYGHLSPACDQYALGVMAYQLLAGRLPFSGGLLELVQAHAREDPPPLRSLNPDVPPAVEAVIMHALAKQPDDRHRSVAAFAQALRTAATGGNTTVVAAKGPGAAWAGRVADRYGGATARTAPASPWAEPPHAASSVPNTYPPTVPFTSRAAASAPATARGQEGNGTRRRLAPGLAVLALLLVTALAGIGLRSHIDVGHAFFSGGTTQPPAGSAGAHTSSPTSPPGAMPTTQGPSGPGQAPTPTSPAQTTPQPSPQPTASATASPTATAPDQPTATPVPKSTATAVPTASATAAPEPTATAEPTRPVATATPPPVATAAPKPAAPLPGLPGPGLGLPAPIAP